MSLTSIQWCISVKPNCIDCKCIIKPRSNLSRVDCDEHMTTPGIEKHKCQMHIPVQFAASFWSTTDILRVVKMYCIPTFFHSSTVNSTPSRHEIFLQAMQISFLWHPSSERKHIIAKEKYCDPWAWRESRPQLPVWVELGFTLMKHTNPAAHFCGKTFRIWERWSPVPPPISVFFPLRMSIVYTWFVNSPPRCSGNTSRSEGVR